MPHAGETVAHARRMLRVVETVVRSPARLLLSVALIAWAAPGVAALAGDYWTTSQGAQGPIILLIGVAALVWQLRAMPPLERAPRLAIVPFVLLVPLYIGSRMTGLLSLEIGCVVASLASLVYLYHGLVGLRAAWVPILFLCALIPPPFTLMLAVTRALKSWLSTQAVTTLDLFGLPVAHDGNTLYVDNYIVVMEAACSGLNSLLSLTSIGFFYIFMQRRRTPAGSIVLMALVVPIAIACNFVRVLALLAGVHWLGPAMLGTALHPGAGIGMFIVALALLVAADAAVARLERTA